MPEQPSILRCDSTQIIVIEAPDGTLWQITVDNDGVISTILYNPQ
jgi:hypothetical protein